MKECTGFTTDVIIYDIYDIYIYICMYVSMYIYTHIHTHIYIIYMVFSTEVFLEVAIESWSDWDLNPRLLNSVQTF